MDFAIPAAACATVSRTLLPDLDEAVGPADARDMHNEMVPHRPRLLLRG
jgi:hypothetical protein